MVSPLTETAASHRFRVQPGKELWHAVASLKGHRLSLGLAGEPFTHVPSSKHLALLRLLACDSFNSVHDIFCASMSRLFRDSIFVTLFQ